jgi:hypothetical protein
LIQNIILIKYINKKYEINKNLIKINKIYIAHWIRTAPIAAGSCGPRSYTLSALASQQPLRSPAAHIETGTPALSM